MEVLAAHHWSLLHLNPVLYPDLNLLSGRVQGSTLQHRVTGVQEVVLLEVEGEEVAVRGEFRRETGGVVGEEEEEEGEVQNRAGQTLLNSSNP